jgi:hypothetical protein
MVERDEGGFKVTDRRKYNPDGSPREGSESEPQPIMAEAKPEIPSPEPAVNNVVSFPAEAAKKQPEPLPRADHLDESGATPRVLTDSQIAAGKAEQAYNQTRSPQSSSRLPEASFLSLANMLAVEAAMHLGLIQSPGEEAPPPDLEAARHLIDMLGMLQGKTRGNLTGEEDTLLENILADLRMQFVAISKRR